MEQCNEDACECSCKCSNQGCGCNAQCECEQSQCCTGEYDKMAMMMYLAKSAKMELVKEKVKKKLEAVDGKKFDRIADFLVEAMAEYKKTEADSIKRKQELREKFEAIFMEG